MVHSMLSPGFKAIPPEVDGFELVPPHLAVPLTHEWRKDREPRTVQFHSLVDVFVVGEGIVFDRHLNIIQASVTQHSDAVIDKARELLAHHLHEGTVQRHGGPLLLLGKAGLNNYGHWLAEMLPLAYLSRKWLLQDGGWRALVPMVYHWMAGPITESLDLLDVTSERRILGNGLPCHVSELVFVVGFTRHGDYFSPLITEAMDEIAARVPASNHARLWITRVGEARSLLDEGTCNRKIAAAGWTIVHPGTISFTKQVSLARGARCMAGVNGAGLANLLFMRPGSSLLSFVPAVMFDLYYWQLALHRGILYREVRSTQQHENGGPTLWDAPLTIPIDAVLTQLARQ